jgi:predicted  nucleic acid-binding Zn-ribbon protein
MSRILNMSVRPIPSQLANFTVLVEELAVVIPSCATLRSKVLLVLSSNGIQDDIQCFLRVPGGAQCGDPLTALLHRNLVTATISMLLTAALTVQSAEPALPHSLAIALVSKQQKLTNIAIHDVPMAPPNAQPSISLFEQECTPSTGRPLEDWRNRLKSELESQSFYQRDSVIRSVAQICQELEIRCETVEEPLRIEKSKSEALTTRVSQLHNRVLTLESEAVDRRLYIDGLEAEIGSAENEKNNIATKLEDLRTQFSSANRKADETLRVAQEDFSALELQYRSTTLTREEDMELLKVERDQLASEVQRKESENMTLRQVHKEQIGDLNREQNRLSEEVQRIKDEKLSLSEVHENLESDFSNLKCGLEAERNTVSQQARELDILMGKGTEVEQCLRSTEAELETVNNQLSELQSRHGEHVRSSEEALRDLEARHKNDIEVATNKANKEYKHLSDELQDAIHDTKQATNAYEDSRRETQLLQTTINSLETNIQQLNDVCSKKDEELEELRTLRSRVLASMGLAAEPSLIRTGLHSNNVANDLRIPKQHRRRKSAIQTQDVAPKGTLSMQGITNLAMETVANAPFTSSDSSRDGSSPKRARARSSFKVPTMHVPNSYADGYQSQSISKKLSSSKRSALRQLSPNRRHTSVGFGVLEKGYGDEDERKEVHDLEKRRGSLCDIEGTMQASFDMDGFLASSTPFTPNNFACGTGRGPEEEELTTEL